MSEDGADAPAERGAGSDALAAFAALAASRIGQRAARQLVASFAQMVQSGTPEAVVRQALAQARASMAAQPSPATPFPLAVAHAIACVGCPNLDAYAQRVAADPAIASPLVERAAVAAHATALVPAFGEEDALFCAQVAWQSHHHFRLRLVVGRTHNRSDATPSGQLFAAWQAAPTDVPIGVVPADVGAPGVIVALGAAPRADIHVPFVAEAFLFRADDGSDVDLSSLRGLQTFLARVQLPPAPRALAWLIHLARMAGGGGVVDVVDDDGVDVVAAWRDREEDPPSGAAAALLGVRPAPPPVRAQLHLRVGSTRLRYAAGELSIDAT